MGTASPPQMLAVIKALARIAARGNESSRTRIAGVALAAVESLAPLREELDEAKQSALDRARAEALLAAGRRADAVEAYARMAKAHPDSGQTQEAYGSILLDSNDPNELNLALVQWRAVARRSPPRSERWRRAKYSAALAQFKMGKRQEAATLLRFVLDTPPGLQGTKWEKSFQELLKKCDN
jgi:tetratricopeptide (TPR) repeat protein